MRFLRRKDALDERVQTGGRRAGPGGRPPHETAPSWGEVGVHGVHRLREWDEVTMVEADGPVEDRVQFVVLPDGSVVGGDPDEAELAAALALEPPYRAEAVLRGLRLWAVAVRRIRVAEFAAPGEELELTRRQGETTLLVDGVESDRAVPELEELAPGDAFMRATRLEGDAWEVYVDRL